LSFPFFHPAWANSLGIGFRHANFLCPLLFFLTTPCSGFFISLPRHRVELDNFSSSPPLRCGVPIFPHPAPTSALRTRRIPFAMRARGCSFATVQKRIPSGVFGILISSFSIGGVLPSVMVYAPNPDPRDFDFPFPSQCSPSP